MPKLPKINWKLFITIMIILVLVVVAVRVIPKFISGGDKDVSYTILEKEELPTKIQEILPRYKMLERALAARLDDEIYVVVTRGEKLTGGYSVDIDKIKLVQEEDETKLMVYAIFKDPSPDDLVPQVITYPHVVARTDLTELPQKVELVPVYIE
ncbi:MAG: protease complex subunit PrcB family protein [Clostridiaceae bacterium]|nr:protease complex subunit PrcB family protein [Clostridiaceae bacterium]